MLRRGGSLIVSDGKKRTSVEDHASLPATAFRVEGVYLTHIDLLDTDLSNLAALQRLKSVVLNGTSIGDQALRELYGFSTVEQIGLVRTKVTLAGVAEDRGLNNFPGCL